jgi:hypothetical protein
MAAAEYGRLRTIKKRELSDDFRYWPIHGSVFHIRHGDHRYILSCSERRAICYSKSGAERSKRFRVFFFLAVFGTKSGAHDTNCQAEGVPVSDLTRQTGLHCEDTYVTVEPGTTVTRFF